MFHRRSDSIGIRKSKQDNGFIIHPFWNYNVLITGDKRQILDFLLIRDRFCYLAVKIGLFQKQSLSNIPFLELLAEWDDQEIENK